MIEVEISDCQSRLAVDEGRIAEAAQRILAEAGVSSASLSVAIVDDPQIHELNRRHLSHDYPTDVLSFVLEQDDASLEGEVIVSADTAAAQGGRYGWKAEDELLLYVIHGLLHLVGHDDATPQARAIMRSAERRHLAAFGLAPQYDEREADGGDRS
jgi:probable rRNA maturation factor